MYCARERQQVAFCLLKHFDITLEMWSFHATVISFVLLALLQAAVCLSYRPVLDIKLKFKTLKLMVVGGSRSEWKSNTFSEPGFVWASFARRMGFTGQGLRCFGFSSQLCHRLYEWPWTSLYFSSPQLALSTLVPPQPLPKVVSAAVEAAARPELW